MIWKKKTAWENRTSTGRLFCVHVFLLTDLRSCRMWCCTLSMERSLVGWPSNEPLSIRCVVQALKNTNTFFSCLQSQYNNGIVYMQVPPNKPSSSYIIRWSSLLVRSPKHSFSYYMCANSCVIWLTAEPCSRTELTLWAPSVCVLYWAIACLLAVTMDECLHMTDCVFWCSLFACVGGTLCLIVCLCEGWQARQYVLWLLIFCLSFRLTE